MKKIEKHYADGSIGHIEINDDEVLINDELDEKPEPLYQPGVTNPETPETQTEKELKQQRKFEDDNDITITPLYPAGVNPE